MVSPKGARPSALSPQVRRRQWVMVALLICAGCVNYIDRSTLSIANHDIAGELHLSPGQMGALLSVFAWAYALWQLPVGAVTDKVGPRLMLALGMAAWSVAQMASGAVRGFGQFLMARVALGVGESPMFTAGTRAVVDWFPLKARGAPLGLFNAASSLGPALAPPLLTAIMLAFGWRPMFVVVGLAGLLVAVAWGVIYRDPERSDVPPVELAPLRADEDDEAPSPRLGAWLQLMRVPTTWAMMGGLFGVVYVTWLYVTWLPAYLESARHVGVAATGWLAAAPQAAGFVGGCLGSVLSDGLAKLGLEPVMSRKAPTIVGLLAAGVFTTLAPLVADTGLSLVLMSAGLFCAYAAGSCSWALGATLAPREAVATLESIQNIGGSIGGALAPLLTGLIVQATHAFTLAFVVAAAAAVASALSYVLVKPGAYDGLAKPG